MGCGWVTQCSMLQSAVTCFTSEGDSHSRVKDKFKLP